MRKSRLIGPAVLAVLALGASQTALPAGDPGNGAAAAGGAHPLLVQAQGRGAAPAFRVRPEFPPPGYLAEFEDMPQGRLVREATPGGPDPRAEREQAPPEFAPGGYERSLPGGAVGRTQTPRIDFGSPMGRGTAPIPPDAVPGRPGYPTAPGGAAGRGEFPGSDMRWQGRAGSPGTGQGHQWPTAPGGSYLSHPEYPSERQERGRPTSPSGGYPPLPESPGRGFDRPR
jgi:hypothetical protein